MCVVFPHYLIHSFIHFYMTLNAVFEYILVKYAINNKTHFTLNCSV